MSAIRLRSTRTAAKAQGVNPQMNSFKRVVVKQSITLTTSGSASDVGTIAIPIARYIIDCAFIVGNVLAGSAAAAVIDLRTASAGGGSSLITTTSTLATLDTITATNKLKHLTIPTQGDVLTSTTLYLRETTNSGNAATVDLYIEIFDLTAAD